MLFVAVHKAMASVTGEKVNVTFRREEKVNVIFHGNEE